MSTSCHDCVIEEKVHVCCGRHPETGERAILEAGSVSCLACPELDGNGSCKIYGDRPSGCREFFCERFDAGSGFFSQGVFDGVGGRDLAHQK